MVTKGVSVFLAGFFSCALLFYLFSYGGSLEVPFVSGILDEANTSPGDHIGEGDIVVFGDYILIKVEDATISRYASTGSMKPLFDTGANGIRVVPEGEEEIGVGDIISFRKDGLLIVHRVIEKGVDDEGVYFVTQGDNSDFSDGKVRFEDIEYLTIGVLY